MRERKEGRWRLHEEVLEGEREERGKEGGGKRGREGESEGERERRGRVVESHI